MSAIISFFKSIWDGFKSLAAWLVGLPALVASSIVGLVSSVRAVISTLHSPSDMMDPLCDSVQGYSATLVQSFQSLPDLVHIACYVLSIDVLLKTVVQIGFFFIEGILLVLVFVLVDIPLFCVALIGLKYSSKFLTVFLPKGFVPTFIATLSNLDISPFRRMITFISKPKNLAP